MNTNETMQELTGTTAIRVGGAGGGFEAVVSPSTSAVLDAYWNMRKGSTLSAYPAVSRAATADQPMAIEARVYDAVANAKIWTASVAAHISEAQRRRLFAQLDSLHDISEWEEGDKPAVLTSFVSFLRAMLFLKPSRWPSLGMSHAGRILASWGTAEDHITLDFSDNDLVVWSLTRREPDGKVVSSVGKGSSLTFRGHLEGFAPGHWFDA